MEEDKESYNLGQLEHFLNSLEELAKKKPEWRNLRSTQYYHIIEAATNLKLKESIDSLNHHIQTFSEQSEKASAFQSRFSTNLNWATWIIGLATLALAGITIWSVKAQFNNSQFMEEVSYRNALALKGLHHGFGLTRSEFLRVAETDLNSYEKTAWDQISFIPNSGSKKMPKVYDIN